MRILYTNNSDRAVHHYGQPIEPGDTILSLSIEDLEAVQKAVEQARITWGGLGQVLLLRRLSKPRKALAEALQRLNQEPADHNDLPISHRPVRHDETCDHTNGMCASVSLAIEQELRFQAGPYGDGMVP